MIILEPHSGLANRMRVIASGIAYAHITNQKLVINWIADDGLACDFEDIFEVIPPKICSSQFLRLARRFVSFMDRRLPSVLDLWGTHFCDSKCRSLMWVHNSNDLEISYVKKNGLNFFHTCNDFFLSKAEYSLFKPKQIILEKIEDNKKKIGKNAIGIHIRRTDHKESISYSPLEEFISAIKVHLDKDMNTKFFLASDDKETIDIIKQQFSDCIITGDVSFGRNSKQAIIDALTDIYTLAHCKQIIGSFNSSFSEVASRINNIPLTVINKR